MRMWIQFNFASLHHISFIWKIRKHAWLHNLRGRKGWTIKVFSYFRMTCLMFIRTTFSHYRQLSDCGVCPRTSWVWMLPRSVTFSFDSLKGVYLTAQLLRKVGKICERNKWWKISYQKCFIKKPISVHIPEAIDRIQFHERDSRRPSSNVHWNFTSFTTVALFIKPPLNI